MRDDMTFCPCSKHRPLPVAPGFPMYIGKGQALQTVAHVHGACPTCPCDNKPKFKTDPERVLADDRCWAPEFVPVIPRGGGSAGVLC